MLRTESAQRNHFMEIISVGSSSSGNSYIILTDESTIILDVGLPARKIMAALDEAGRSPEDVSAVLITHEHTDHVKSVRAVGRKCINAVFYASLGTVENTKNFEYIDKDRIGIVSAGNSFSLGDAEIVSFKLSHDAAEPLGFTVASGGTKLAVVTDCGTVTDEIYDAVCDADILVFESNHDENMLMYGAYPYPLKVRIKSDYGHLSNESAGNALAALIKRRKSVNREKETGPLRIVLAHLSFNNNAPFFARRTVEGALSEAGFEKEIDYYLEIASKDEIMTVGNAM